MGGGGVVRIPDSAYQRGSKEGGGASRGQTDQHTVSISTVHTPPTPDSQAEVPNPNHSVACRPPGPQSWALLFFTLAHPPTHPALLILSSIPSRCSCSSSSQPSSSLRSPLETPATQASPRAEPIAPIAPQAPTRPPSTHLLASRVPAAPPRPRQLPLHAPFALPDSSSPRKAPPTAPVALATRCSPSGVAWTASPVLLDPSPTPRGPPAFPVQSGRLGIQ